MTREIIAYQVIDSRTGARVGAVYPFAKRRAAWAKADRMDAIYGACRYAALPIYADEVQAA